MCDADYTGLHFLKSMGFLENIAVLLPSRSFRLKWIIRGAQCLSQFFLT